MTDYQHTPTWTSDFHGDLNAVDDCVSGDGVATVVDHLRRHLRIPGVKVYQAAEHVRVTWTDGPHSVPTGCRAFLDDAEEIFFISYEIARAVSAHVVAASICHHHAADPTLSDYELAERAWESVRYRTWNTPTPYGPQRSAQAAALCQTAGVWPSHPVRGIAAVLRELARVRCES